MQIRSPSGTSPPGTGSIVFPTGKLSPVSAASSISSVAATTDPAVRGDPVARFDKDHVARNELLGVDLDRLAVPTNPGDRLHHLRQRLHARLGLRLLAESDHRVENGEPREHDRRPGVVRDERVDHGRREEDDLHEVLVLAHEGVEPRLLLPAGELVRAMGAQSLGGLRGRQPLLRFDAELAGDLRDLHGMRVGLDVEPPIGMVVPPDATTDPSSREPIRFYPLASPANTAGRSPSNTTEGLIRFPFGPRRVD